MIDHIDHIVLTTVDESACIAFYQGVLGMKLEVFNENRKALIFGNQKINIHVKGKEVEPKAHLPVSGSLDLCFIASIPLAKVVENLRMKSVSIVEGPVRRTGANGPIESVYLRDPDLNLVEISQYIANS